MANIPGFSDYTNLLATQQSKIGQVDPEKLQEADDKRTALENIKQFGEVKTYLSGKPVLQKMLNNLSKSAPKDLEAVGVNTQELGASYSAGLRAAGNEAQNMLSSAGRAVGSVFGKSAPVRQTAQDIIGEADPEDLLNFGASRITSSAPAVSSMSRVADIGGEGAISKPLTEVSDSLNEGLAETSFGTVARQTIGSAVGKSGVAKATTGAAGEETTGAAVGETEAVASVLDGIPGAEVVGLVAGIGATLYGAFHHVKNPKPVDNIHVAPQAGVE